MAKKEKIFPLSTVGGKIQNLRKKAKLSRSQLYDLVYKISECDYNAGSDNSKEKTVYNWESGKTQLSYETMKAVCQVLKCSADYLLGLEECTNKTSQFINEKTGLSEQSINTLAGLKGLLKLFPEDSNIKDKYRIINLILMDTHKKQSLSSLLDRLVGFCQFSVNKNYAYTVDTNGITPFQGHKSISGKGISYNPSQAHFRLQDMESMYYLKIWDSIKELKEEYEKVSDTN